MTKPLRLGISACLLGDEVRFDGQHKRDRFLVDELGPTVEWVRVCPEVEVGMGVPRESVRLVRAPGRSPGDVLMLGNKSGTDWTARMERFAEARVRQLEPLDLCGYVLKSHSPSCGMERVKLYASTSKEAQGPKEGVGLFAAALMKRFPDLPIEEEGRLNDPHLRENFIERIFAYRRLQALWSSRWTVGALVAFHTAHKLTLLAHSPAAYRALGPLVARAKSLPRGELREAYSTAFMAAMKKLATPGKHANVLMHMAGYLRDKIDAADRAEIMGVTEDYRTGLVPLVVPLTLIKHHVRRHAITYLLGQTYLDPHPKELMLRNRV